jgi:hypothetical protein
MKLDRRNDPVTITDFRGIGSREVQTRQTVTAWLMAVVIIVAFIVGVVAK